MNEAPKRPIVIWIAIAVFVALVLIDIIAPLFVLGGRPISTSLVEWVQYSVVLIGLLGFWRMKWWGLLLIALVLASSYLQFARPVFQDPEVLLLGFTTMSIATLLLIGPLLLAALAYRRRFKWEW